LQFDSGACSSCHEHQAMVKNVLEVRA